jgi:2-polyprenyl-3-methyl-5-hydroxy-6-metoxy-1,4-benzoquinol methylase
MPVRARSPGVRFWERDGAAAAPSATSLKHGRTTPARLLPHPGNASWRARTGPAQSLRVADVGCGAGWSTIAVARAFPKATVVGFDADAASIIDAKENAAAQHVGADFQTRDAATLADAGRFDLILVLEALHDMARPADVLRSLGRALMPDGSVLVADERVADRFHAPGDDMERLMYGWSIVHCLPVAMSESPSAAIGTVIRSDTVRELARTAGFARVEVLPVNAGFFRIYRLSLG